MDAVANAKKKVRVLVADDHPLYREGVVRALNASGRVEVVAQAEDGRGALEQIREHAPDVALIDYKLPDLDGVSVVHAVTRDGCGVRLAPTEYKLLAVLARNAGRVVSNPQLLREVWGQQSANSPHYLRILIFLWVRAAGHAVNRGLTLH